MLERNYESEEMDDSDDMLDKWKPSMREFKIPKSEWRQKQNNGDHNQKPGIDELKKIIMYVKKKYPDHQIMDAFGLSCEVLVAIKRNCYDPVEGISLDNQTKILKEFARINKKLEKTFDAFKFLSNNIFNKKENDKRNAFKIILALPKRKKKTQGLEFDEEE